jgi:hypothetical protein
VSSIEKGFEHVGELLFDLATMATGLLVLAHDSLDLVEGAQM